jgi:iron complex transport system ATP-binding protein
MSVSSATPEVQSQRFSYELHDVSFRYGEAWRHTGRANGWAVEGITFRVAAGEIFGIIGPNGSGKSSLLKVLANMVKPQRGTVRLFGETLALWSREAVARQAAYMPQDVASDFAFSAREMVLMGRFPHRQRRRWDLLGWEDTDDHIAVEHAMAQTDVTHLAEREVGTLSAGERQRVLLARALAQQPRVLLLDEPTAHLDLLHQLDLCRILKRVHAQKGLTVILVSHDINLASQYCDRILMMKRGRLMTLGSPREVITVPALEEVYGCRVLIDGHPDTGLPRVCLPFEETSASRRTAIRQG